MVLAARCAAIVLLALAAGCGSESSGKNGEPAPRAHLVELASAELGALAYTADRAGSLRALREVKIVNQEPGEIIEVRARVGERVAAGRVLVRYDERLLRAQLDKASATLKQAELDQRRNRQLESRGFVSEDAVSRAATVLEIARAEERLLRERLRNLTIAAPFAGVVSQRLVEPGNVTPVHTHLMTVIDPSQLITDVTVSELALPYVRVGDPASVRIDALGETLHPGSIVRIHPSIDPLTRTGRVEVVLDPVPRGARPGQFCRVVLSSGGRERLLVPLAALRRDAQGEHVFVFQEDGTVRRAAVSSGLRLDDRVEIREGLAPGARVVTKGFIGLAAGQRVKPVEAPGA
ncbi:MAG TPA: efflux RND transporter periplasmic adaptor subunit [Burkholderiales bacterium]|jgi:membrane fusion protein (multidrug efflux system)|nr:efflux RND transporter periplasmic adaptor subunit [Burkholderiales bacterium]